MEEIKLFAVHTPQALDKPLLEVLHSGYIGQGKKVEEFEEKLALYVGNKNALSVNSATSGLELALHLAGVGRDSEVISTPMTCMATNTPIISRGAIPVWADVNPNTGLIDPLDIERKITKKTKAIMCVHWAGLPCDMDALMALGTSYGIPVIEDAAHAFGARYGGRRVGDRTADFTVFSFQAIKHITTGDGGVVFTNSSESYRRGKLLRWYGIDRDGERKDMRCEENVVEAGWKFHMNDLAAMMGIVQMDYIEGILKLHRENARFYYDNIEGPQPTFSEEAFGGDGYESSFWLYTILCNDLDERLEFMEYMKQSGIMTSQVHARHDTHTTFLPYLKSPLPGVTEFCERQVSIPVHWNLKLSERELIVDRVNEFYHKRIRVNA